MMLDGLLTYWPLMLLGGVVGCMILDIRRSIKKQRRRKKEYDRLQSELNRDLARLQATARGTALSEAHSAEYDELMRRRQDERARVAQLWREPHRVPVTTGPDWVVDYAVTSSGSSVAGEWTEPRSYWESSSGYTRNPTTAVDMTTWGRQLTFTVLVGVDGRSYAIGTYEKKIVVFIENTTLANGWLVLWELPIEDFLRSTGLNKGGLTEFEKKLYKGFLLS